MSTLNIKLYERKNAQWCHRLHFDVNVCLQSRGGAKFSSWEHFLPLRVLLRPSQPFQYSEISPTRSVPFELWSYQTKKSNYHSLSNSTLLWLIRFSVFCVSYSEVPVQEKRWKLIPKEKMRCTVSIAIRVTQLRESAM